MTYKDVQENYKEKGNGIHIVADNLYVSGIEYGAFCKLNISEVEEECEASDFVKGLNVNGNLIKSLERNKFKALPKASNFSARHNYISTLNSDTFNGLSDLQHLDLGHNDINYMDDDVFESLALLETLNLEYNSIGKMGSVLLKNQQLEYLNLGNNLITSFGKGLFNKLSNLNQMYINNNRLESLDLNWFIDNEKLKYLNSSNNRFTSILGNLNETPGLSSLILNNITTNNFDVFGLREFLEKDGVLYIMSNTAFYSKEAVPINCSHSWMLRDYKTFQNMNVNSWGTNVVWNLENDTYNPDNYLPMKCIFHFSSNNDCLKYESKLDELNIICEHGSIDTYTQTHTHNTHKRTHIHTHKHTYKHINTHKRTHIHTHKHTYIYTH